MACGSLNQRGQVPSNKWPRWLICETRNEILAMFDIHPVFPQSLSTLGQAQGPPTSMFREDIQCPLKRSVLSKWAWKSYRFQPHLCPFFSRTFWKLVFSQGSHAFLGKSTVAVWEFCEGTMYKLIHQASHPTPHAALEWWCPFLVSFEGRQKTGQ